MLLTEVDSAMDMLKLKIFRQFSQLIAEATLGIHSIFTNMPFLKSFYKNSKYKNQE